eukprot:5375912-Pleurochrysis_carterae.AAC.3
MGNIELADNPIYQEARRRGKKFIRDTHKPPVGGDKCESEVARGMVNGYNTEEDGESDIEMDIERQDGKREVETFVHGLRNGEIVGGPASERRMRHATKEGNRPSFWTYLKVNGCRGCQKQEEEETIQHVLSGGCEGIRLSKNDKYRTEMKRAFSKCGKLMNDIKHREGADQILKASRALEQPRRQTDQRLKEEEELALKQVISGIIPEWRNADYKRKKGVIALLGTWTGEMMNWARMQMKEWVIKKNEHKASVQRRWDNRGKMHSAFRKWRKGVGQDYHTQTGRRRGEKRRKRRMELNTGVGLGQSRGHIFRFPEAYILASRGVSYLTLPYSYRLLSVLKKNLFRAEEVARDTTSDVNVWIRQVQITSDQLARLQRACLFSQ